MPSNRHAPWQTLVSNLRSTGNVLALVGCLWSVKPLDQHQSKWHKTIVLNINFMIVLRTGSSCKASSNYKGEMRNIKKANRMPLARRSELNDKQSHSVMKKCSARPTHGRS